MIIDSHIHIGRYQEWDCKLDLINQLMKENGISMCIASDLLGNEIGAKSTEIALAKIKDSDIAIKLLLWVNPNVEGDHRIAETLLENNQGNIVGIKVHPWTAKVPLNNSSYEWYLSLCRQYQLPFVAHTQKDGYSNISYLTEMALRNPDINFIAVHMELSSNHQDAMVAIKNYDNLYGDTTFVAVDDVRQAIEVCGTDKILLGSDAPILGEQSYQDLNKMKDMITKQYGEQVLDLVMYGNCKRVFHL